MRARVEEERRAASDFDVKLAPGGLMDCEFAAQFLVLSGLGRVAGEATEATLLRAAAAGRIAPPDAERLALSTALQTALLQIARVGEAKNLADAPDALKKLVVWAADTMLRSDGVGAERAGVDAFADLQEKLGGIQRATRRALESLLGIAVAMRT
jgi:[glutamine synthetase] adenylyltransferase / [glutamine synthetase]-adenylyl-L-tyrosine phosphorylase